MIGFEVYVQAGATAWTTAEVEVSCAPIRLLVSPTSKAFVIAQLQISRLRYVVGAARTPVPADVFIPSCEECSQHTVAKFDFGGVVIPVGAQVMIEVMNPTKEALIFRAALEVRWTRSVP